MKKKLILFLSVILGFVIFSPILSVSASTPVNATENSSTSINSPIRTELDKLIKFADGYIINKNNVLVISNESIIFNYIAKNELALKSELGLSKKEIFNELKNLIANFNNISKSKTLNSNKSLRIASPRNSGHTTGHYWWGVSHSFYTDASANAYAYKVRMLAHANAGVAVIAGVLLPGVGAIPNGLTAVYAYSVADTVDYNANKQGSGVVLDINYWLTYNCRPR